jgi:threonine dehydrogenase-like Zn-dependent dehydrogenase
VKAATFHEPGDLRIEDILEPTPGPNELKLRMRATATCGTDAKTSRWPSSSPDRATARRWGCVVGDSAD